MGGHGGYVWSAYGITVMVLIISGWAAAHRHRQALRAAKHAGAGPGPVRRPKVTEL
ncbi:MAG: heme exporter protein CcmD [Gammaproteobacteria bacterium]